MCCGLIEACRTRRAGGAGVGEGCRPVAARGVAVVGPARDPGHRQAQCQSVCSGSIQRTGSGMNAERMGLFEVKLANADPVLAGRKLDLLAVLEKPVSTDYSASARPIHPHILRHWAMVEACRVAVCAEMLLCFLPSIWKDSTHSAIPGLRRRCHWNSVGCRRRCI